MCNFIPEDGNLVVPTDLESFCDEHVAQLIELIASNAGAIVTTVTRENVIVNCYDALHGIDVEYQDELLTATVSKIEEEDLLHEPGSWENIMQNIAGERRYPTNV